MEAEETEPSLAARLERIERRLALYHLIASYGPAVDSGSARAAAEMWSSDGSYDYRDDGTGERCRPGRQLARADT